MLHRLYKRALTGNCFRLVTTAKTFASQITWLFRLMLNNSRLLKHSL